MTDEPRTPEETIKLLKNALLKYGGHKDYCEINRSTMYRRLAGERCTCGWKQLFEVFLKD